MGVLAPCIQKRDLSEQGLFMSSPKKQRNHSQPPQEESEELNDRQNQHISGQRLEHHHQLWQQGSNDNNIGRSLGFMNSGSIFEHTPAHPEPYCYHPSTQGYPQYDRHARAHTYSQPSHHHWHSSSSQHYVPAASYPDPNSKTDINDDGTWICNYCQRGNFRQFLVCQFCDPEDFQARRSENMPTYNTPSGYEPSHHYDRYPHAYHPQRAQGDEFPQRALGHEFPAGSASTHREAPTPGIDTDMTGYMSVHCSRSFDLDMTATGYMSVPRSSSYDSSQFSSGSKRPYEAEEEEALSQDNALLQLPEVMAVSPPPGGSSQTENPSSNVKQKSDDPEITASIAHLEANNFSQTYADGSKVPESRRLVHEQDQPLLTDYIAYLMKQLRHCQFAEQDRKSRGGKRGDLSVGFGGLECVHCERMNKKHPRKFFWATADRLANSFAEIPNHILKCKACPKETQDALLKLKAKHAEQMSRLPRGSQKVFFRRVWKRIHHMGSCDDRQQQKYEHQQEVEYGSSILASLARGDRTIRTIHGTAAATEPRETEYPQEEDEDDTEPLDFRQPFHH